MQHRVHFLAIGTENLHNLATFGIGKAEDILTGRQLDAGQLDRLIEREVRT